MLITVVVSNTPRTTRLRKYFFLFLPRRNVRSHIASQFPSSLAPPSRRIPTAERSKTDAILVEIVWCLLTLAIRMPASVRSACACSVSIHRLAADFRPASASFRVTPVLTRRQQTRHFRVWWSSPWDPDHSRRYRELWQKYAKLRSNAWGPLWGFRHPFPPLMRDMEKLENFLRELETELATRQTGKPHHKPQSWSDSCARHVPPRRCGSYGTRFQHTGHGEPDGPEGDRGSSSPVPQGNNDGPVVHPKESYSALGEENIWTARPPEPKDYFIDPVTNKKIPRPGQNVPKDEASYESAGTVEPSSSTTAIHLGPGSAEIGKHEEDVRSIEEQPVDLHCHSEQSYRETSTEKSETSTSLAAGKDEDKNVKPVDAKPQSPAVQETDTDCGTKGGPPSKGEKASSGTQLQKEKPRMTGNYVKDFPEEFAGAWRGCYRPETAVDGKPSTGRLEPALSRTREPPAVSTPKTEKTEPAVERRTTHDELVEQIRDIYLDSNAAHEVGPPHSPSSLSEAPSDKTGTSKETTADKPDDSPGEVNQQPTLYKILVYDAKTETVNAADATSVVPDDMKAVTPAEAVTRLSNPAKFLPHFGPLQAQGYEVVSGEDDVLVFRKTREATEPGTAFLRGTRYASLPEPKPASPAVNPIDMMGSESVIPNTGNFASPTGYANYGEGEREDEGVSKRKPPPPFRDASEIDYKEESTGKRRPGILWRASVGAVWVAGLMYGGSVVSEYFTTGGENGKGSRGRLN